MPVPDFQSLMLPALKAFATGAESPLSEVRERIAVAEGLSAEDVREMLPSGRQTVFVNRVSWAVSYMERAGLLERVRRGVYRLTQEGERLLSRSPSRIDVNLLGEYRITQSGRGGRTLRLPAGVRRRSGAPMLPKRRRKRWTALPNS